MATVLLHCPLNISRSLVQMVTDFSKKLSEKHQLDIEVMVQPHRPDEKSLFGQFIEQKTLPDMIIGHIDDFAELPDDFLQEQVRSLPEIFLLRDELKNLGFKDEAGFFHPFAVIPFAIFFNQTMLSENDLPKSWQDLLAPRWRQQILMPDDFRIVSAVVRAYLKADFPDDFVHFEDNFIRQGSPLEVVTAVDDGRYPIGVTNIAFARISKQKNTRIIWPQEGLFCMPQVVVFKRDCADPLLEIGDYLLSAEVQNFLALQSFIPAAPGIELHPFVQQHDCRVQWKGWRAFFEVLQARGNNKPER